MNEEYDLENYERFLGEFRSEGVHWEKLEKRTATLFQVLIDGDLKELVFVLKHYPEYVETVCDHFRYLYNYSEQVANIYAASKLLQMSEGYHPKQFVRNLTRKLQKIDEYDISDLKSFLDEILDNIDRIHPIILGYYKQSIQNKISDGSYHILQVKVIEKKLNSIDVDVNLDFSASDRDAALDIPYMD